MYKSIERLSEQAAETGKLCRMLKNIGFEYREVSDSMELEITSEVIASVKMFECETERYSVVFGVDGAEESTVDTELQVMEGIANYAIEQWKACARYSEELYKGLRSAKSEIDSLIK